MASVTTPVSADPEYADQILALGLDEATAAFMARTLSNVDVVDAHTFVVHHAMPTGAVADETYHLVRGSGMSPGDPPTIVYEVVGDELRYQLRYAVDSAELPEDLRDQVLTGLPALAETSSSTTAGTIRLLGLARVGPVRGVFAADAPGTVDVVVDGSHLAGQEHRHRQVRRVREEARLHQDSGLVQGLQGGQEGLGGVGGQRPDRLRTR